MPFLKSAFNSVKRTFLGRRRATRRLDRLLKTENKIEALRLKRYRLKKPKYRVKFAKPTMAKSSLSMVRKPTVLINPYQSCRSKAVRTFALNLIGNQLPVDNNYYNANTVDLTGSVNMTACGISAWWLRSFRTPDYIYFGISVPDLDIRQVEDVATLTALSALYQYFRILSINLTIKFDMGNIKNEVREGGLVETGLYEHFTYPSTKGEKININTPSGIMSDSAWEFVKESGIKIHKTRPVYNLSFKPRFQLDPKTIIGSGATLPISIKNRSVSMDDIAAGNIPRMPSPAVVFKLRCPVSEFAKATVEIKLQVNYKNGGRVSHGFDPTTPY